MSRPSAVILCEISAPRSSQAAVLAEIAGLCARDTGQRLIVKTPAIGPAAEGRDAVPVITLHLPAELAASQHPIWCLACRLACFCPDARVSVLVQGAFASGETGERVRRRRSA